MDRLKSMLQNTHVITVLVILAVSCIIAIGVAFPTVAGVIITIVWCGVVYILVHTIVVEIIEMW